MEQGALENIQELGERGPSALYRNVDITEDLAREAILQYLSSTFCCRRSSAGELVITRLTQMPLYRYGLKSFTETRQIEKTCKPYTGQKLDKLNKGAAPQLWDITVPTPKMFLEGSERIPLPHSSEIKVCHKCQGRGRCKKEGSWKFRGRSGSQQQSRNKRYHGCPGNGKRRFRKSSTQLSKLCPVCQGGGRLIHYQQLTVTWKTLHSEHICKSPIPELNFPTRLLRKVTGEVIVKDSDKMLALITTPLPQATIFQLTFSSTGYDKVQI
ncbi:protein SSUH2 homolog isoform X2 [Pyxicephalus adspersus]|uniref:protein SSUH2 homolog isoform X2 n=1 Tax=Pyxicephalus adspersus TaxID=30357 RepID=UPI003B5968B5